MADDLSLKAKRLLASQHDKLLHDDTVVAKTSSILNEILSWCDDLEFKPGKWIKPKKTYRFDREALGQINKTLLDEDYASIFDNFCQDSHRSAAQRNPNEKQGKLKPTHNLILTAIIEGTVIGAVNQGFYPSQQVNIELDIRHLKLDAFDHLIIVENRDSFNDWFEYNSFTRLSNSLVIYRGDNHYSTACKTLLKSWLNIQGSKPAIYFGDFDLAGFRIAISAGYSHLLLPEYHYLAKHVIKQHYPDNQQEYLTNLERDCPVGWQPLLSLMCDKRAGLRQQKMYQTSLKMYPRIASL